MAISHFYIIYYNFIFRLIIIFVILKYSVLKKGFSPIDVLYAGLPAGTVSGAPKIRSLEILEEQENINREFYSGSVFYLDINGDMDSCINLRTALIKDKVMHVQAGAGIVADSIPKNEYNETLNKAAALFKAAKNAYKEY